MCWNSTAPRLWWKESGKWICYLWGLKIQTVQGWLRKKECECALREEKPTVSHRCDRHWLIVFFFFLPYCQEQLPGVKEMRKSFCGKWKLVSNDCCYLCYVATSAFCQLQVSFYVNNLNWAAQVSESARSRQHALPTTELFPCIKRPPPHPSLSTAEIKPDNWGKHG